MGNHTSLHDPITVFGFFDDTGFRIKHPVQIVLEDTIDYIEKNYNGLLVVTIDVHKKEPHDLFFLTNEEFVSLGERSNMLLLVPFVTDLIHRIYKGYTSEIDIYTLESMKEHLLTSVRKGLRSAPLSFPSDA